MTSPIIPASGPINQRGFTLTEVLVATMILMIMSTVMLGALFHRHPTVRTRRTGKEHQRRGDDCFCQFAAGFCGTGAPADGGEFLAEITDAHNCIMGMTIRDPASSNRDKTSFIEWYVEDFTLYRRVRSGLGNSRILNNQPISSNVLHFSIYAATEADALPDDRTWWTLLQDSTSVTENATATRPTRLDPILHDENDGIRGYPYAVRMNLIVAGGKRVTRSFQGGNRPDVAQFSGQGRLNSDLRANDFDEIRATGAGSFAAGPGSVAVIGDGNNQEVVGYHALRSGNLVLNGESQPMPKIAVAFNPNQSSRALFSETEQELWQHGPLGIGPATGNEVDDNDNGKLTGGRGLFRSQRRDHDRNTIMLWHPVQHEQGAFKMNPSLSASQTPTAHRPQLLALDLDGTTVDDNCRIPTAHKETIAAFTAAGVHVCLVTGRPLLTTQTVHQELNLTTPVVSFNGAWVGSADGTPIASKPLSAENVRLALDAISPLLGDDAAVGVYPDAQRWLLSALTPSTR